MTVLQENGRAFTGIREKRPTEGTDTHAILPNAYLVYVQKMGQQS